jgi:hypothetical protein
LRLWELSTTSLAKNVHELTNAEFMPSTDVSVKSEGGDAWRPQLKRVPLDLRDLVPAKLLSRFTKSRWSEMCFFDSAFEPISTGGDHRDLCRVVKDLYRHPEECSDCQRLKVLVQFAQFDHREVSQIECNSGVLWTMAPVEINGAAVGWVSGPQYVNDALYQAYEPDLDAASRDILKPRRGYPPDSIELKDEVAAAAAKLRKICRVKRRKRVMSGARRKIRSAQTPEAVFDILFHALGLLYAPLHAIYLYALGRDRALHPVKATRQAIVARYPGFRRERDMWAWLSQVGNHTTLKALE